MRQKEGRKEEEEKSASPLEKKNFLRCRHRLPPSKEGWRLQQRDVNSGRTHRPLCFPPQTKICQNAKTLQCSSPLALSFYYEHEGGWHKSSLITFETILIGDVTNFL